MDNMGNKLVWRATGKSYRNIDMENIAKAVCKEKGFEYHHFELDMYNKAIRICAYQDGKKVVENVYFWDLNKHKVSRQGEKPYLEYNHCVYYKDDMDLFTNAYAMVVYGLPVKSYRVSHKKDEITIKCDGGFFNSPVCTLRLIDIERMLVSLINTGNIGV